MVTKETDTFSNTTPVNSINCFGQAFSLQSRVSNRHLTNTTNSYKKNVSTTAETVVKREETSFEKRDC